MSSFVSAGVRSVAGKITRSGLETRTSRPPASTKASAERAMARNRSPPCGWPIEKVNIGYEGFMAGDTPERHVDTVREELRREDEIVREDEDSGATDAGEPGREDRPDADEQE